MKRVYSHPVALGQCRRFLSGRPEIRPVAAYDTAGSVKMIIESREAGAAAIASVAAAEVYGARILIPGIEDDQANFTRFLLLAREDACAETLPDADKTSIVFSLENRTGSLYRAMAVFALRDIDLLKIESRPLIGSGRRRRLTAREYRQSECGDQDDGCSHRFPRGGEVNYQTPHGLRQSENLCELCALCGQAFVFFVA